MIKRVNWTITDRNVSVNYDGQTHIVPRSDALADRLIKAVKEGKLSEIPALVDTATRIEVYSKGNFLVKDGQVYINGQAAPQVLSDKIIRFSNDGLPFQPLLKFAENLQSNPSFRAVNELFTFLEKNDHPLTENGNFIAYKRVKANFMDIYSGTFDNSPGKEPSVPRNQVDEDSSRTCSNGLHVANWYYAHTQFGSSVRDSDIMLEVEVNPSDVVAIPVDYNNSKMRVCKYKVLGVVTTPFDEGTALRVVDPNFNGIYDVDDEDEEKEEEVEEVDTCNFCGADVYDGEELCVECEYDEENDKESDRYPYEDEIE